MIYLDNAATSPLLPEVKQFIVDHFDFYGNPSSLYYKGYEAKELLEGAREIIAECINANPEDIYFTSGGSEANTQALSTYNGLGSTIAISSFEHPSVQNNAHNVYYTAQKIKPDNEGVISTEKFSNELLYGTRFASIMMVNNEIGSIQPIKEIVKIAHERKCIVHTDAVQAVGHIPIDVKDLGVDMLSASSHKFGGPRGVGFIYCNTENNIFPYKLIKGGGQERGYRAGTENVIGAAAMALALKISVDNLEKNTIKVLEMRDYILKELVKISGTRFNSSMTNCAPGIINVSFKNLKGDEIQSMLDERNIAVSTGSACHSGIKEPSQALVSINVPEEYLHGAIRISISHMNTMDEIKEFIRNLKEVVEILRRY